MGKSIENRGSLGLDLYARISNAELKKAPYKQGLLPLFDNYQANVEKYRGTGKDSIVTRKANLTKTLDAYDTELNSMITQTQEYKANFEKTHTENIAKFVESEKKYQEAKGNGKDPNVMTGLLKDWIAKLGEVAKQDKALQDKKEKVNAAFVAHLQKMSGAFDKESKAIDATMKQLSTNGDALESQMKALIQTNRKIAEQQKNKALADSLGEALALLLQ
jgi:hypothetical protein